MEKERSRMGTQTLTTCWKTWEEQIEKENGYIAKHTDLQEDKIYMT